MGQWGILNTLGGDLLPEFEQWHDLCDVLNWCEFPERGGAAVCAGAGTGPFCPAWGVSNKVHVTAHPSVSWASCSHIGVQYFSYPRALFKVIVGFAINFCGKWGNKQRLRTEMKVVIKSQNNVWLWFPGSFSICFVISSVFFFFCFCFLLSACFEPLKCVKCYLS